MPCSDIIQWISYTVTTMMCEVFQVHYEVSWLCVVWNLSDQMLFVSMWYRSSGKCWVLIQTWSWMAADCRNTSVLCWELL